MKLFWKFYSIMFFFISLGSLLYLLNPSSSNHQFYQILIQFNPANALHYWANVTALFITFFSSIVVIAYAFNRRIVALTSPFLFFLRIFFDIIGHNYDWQTIHSYFHNGILLGFAAICNLLIVPLAASYFAHWQYIQHERS